MLLQVALFALTFPPANAAMPNRQPQLAVGNGMVVAVYGSGDSIWFSKSTDNGRTWNARTKAATLTKLHLGRHRGPRVAIAGNTVVISAIDAAGTLQAVRSTDSGKTWSKPVAISDVPKSAEEGLHAMAADAQGNLTAVWLDDRVKPGKRVWGSFSKDGGATWSKNVMLYQSPSGSTCECCHPSLTATADGDFLLMFRNALQGSRDMYYLRLHSGAPAGAATKLGPGTWKLEACPMDGGGIAMRNGNVVSAWRREKEIYLSENPSVETRIGTGTDPALAVTAKGAFVAWTTPEGIRARVPGNAQPVTVSNAGSFPSLIALPDGAVLAAWEENGAIATHRLE
jgi:hypothetical protein